MLGSRTNPLALSKRDRPEANFSLVDVRGMERTVQATYDPEVDIVMVYFAKAKHQASEEIHPGIIADFDAEGGIISLEILNASAALVKGAIASIPPADYSSLPSGAV
jgi:uncharacterized protein YuzE